MDVKEIKQKLNYYFIEGGIHLFNDVFMTLDGEYYLFHKQHPPSPLFIFSKNTGKPNFNKLIFYSNCLAYLHNVPFVLYSEKDSDNLPFISPVRHPDISNSSNDALSYHTNIQQIFEALISIKIEGHISFLWEEAYERAININLYSTYSCVLEELQLYSMALKQYDPFLEFLCYYRIIECVAKNKHKEWIKNNIDNALQYDFGFLEIYDSVISSFSGEQIERINLFSIYKERAISRKKAIENSNDRPIEQYLYYTVRCGIAHGRDEIFTDNYNNNFKDVAQDLFVIKLLARYAVESKSNL